MRGYFNNLLRVDLSTGEISTEHIDDSVFRTYLGGVGLGTYYLINEVPARTEALSPENKLIFATGPFQGTGVPGSGKWVVVSRSPLTSTFGSSAAGASWGIAAKRTGFDAIIIEGRSDRPVYLWITEGKAEIRPAGAFGGQDALETVESIRQDLKEPGASVACIGPAGERGVAIACIIVDSHSFAGRCGLGAVMGSKNLKAVAVKGGARVPVACKDELSALAKSLSMRLFEANKSGMREHGTAGGVVGSEAIGDFPIRNWSGDVWPEGAPKIGAPRFTEALGARPLPCMSCPIGCHRHIKVQWPDLEVEGAGPEYESIALLGGSCAIDDLMAVTRANELCNRLGLDTISAGSFVAFTMDCYHNGLLTPEDMDGLEPSWGNGAALVELIRQIGMRQGFGAIFADGIRRAAERIGPGARALACEVKCLDLPGHDPRTYFSLALTYATSPRGACHLHGFSQCGETDMILPEIGITAPPRRFDMAGMPALAVAFQNYACVLDSLVDCCFMQICGMRMDETVRCLNFITGDDWTPESLMRCGDRIFNLQRLVNVRDGLSRKDDRLPPKMFVPAAEGFRKGMVPEPFEDGLSEYYRLRGWDEDGRPTRAQFEALGLGAYARLEE